MKTGGSICSVVVASLAAAFTWCAYADTTIYDDGTWIVVGADDTGPNPSSITVSVAGVPAGSFSELKLYREFGGGFPQVFTVKGNGPLLSTVAPGGEFGGVFHLSQYWDCVDGLSPELSFTELDIEPNTDPSRSLITRGRLSNGNSLQATDLVLEFHVSNDNTPRMNVDYTLYALRDFCVDPWKRELKEAFRVAWMSANYISSSVHQNDGARVNGVVGKVCDYWDCWKVNGSVCAGFINDTDYVFPYPIRMAGESLHLMNWQPGSQNTPALKIEMKAPSNSKLSAQGFLTETINPGTQNVELWVNLDKAKKQYKAGKQVGRFQFVLWANIPEAKSCEFIVY